MEVKAKIVNSTKEPLIGVNVHHFAKDDSSPKIAVTNVEGEFSIEVDDTKNITISYVGFQEISLNPKDVKDGVLVLKENEELEVLLNNDTFDKPISYKKETTVTKTEKNIPYGYITIGALILASAIYYFKLKDKWKI